MGSSYDQTTEQVNDYFSNNYVSKSVRLFLVLRSEDLELARSKKKATAASGSVFYFAEHQHKKKNDVLSPEVGIINSNCSTLIILDFMVSNSELVLRGSKISGEYTVSLNIIGREPAEIATAKRCHPM